MSYRMASSPQYGASSSNDFGSRTQFGSTSISGFLGSEPNSLASSSALSVQSLRKNAREAERRLGEAIDAVSYSIENAPADVVQLQLRDAQALLDQLTELNKTLSRVSTETSLDPAQSGTQYHQDKLRYFAQSYRRIKLTWDEKRQREELLHHAPHQRDNSEDGETSIAMQTMMADSNSLASSNRTMNSIVEQGQEVKELLIRGRLALSSATSRIQHSIGAFASIDGAMRIIQRAKIKNTIILGVVIGLCLCVFLWMMF